MARKKHGSEELLAPDAFQKQGSGWSRWLEKNIRLVLVGIVVTLVAVVAAELVLSQSQRSASQMTAQFGDALDAYREATDPSFAQTATSATVIERRRREARAAFEELRASTSAAGAERLALLYEADLAQRAGDHSAAAALYQDYLDRAPEDAPLRYIALEGAGYAHEALEAWDEALGYFEALEERPFYEAWALKHQARVLEAKGDREAAVERLERLLELDAGPFLQNHAETQLKLLR